MKIFCIFFVVLVSISLGMTLRRKQVHPFRFRATALGVSADTCSTQSTINEEVRKTKSFFQKKNWFRTCECGGPEWERVAYYDFSETECPSNFTRAYGSWNDISCQLNTNNKYGGCGFSYYFSSLVFPVKQRPYSSVCGRIRGHGWGWGFRNAIICGNSLEDVYVSGVSLTHGVPGNRTHIWTFSATYVDGNSQFKAMICPCSNTNATWPRSIPEYVGPDYYCDSAAESKNGFTEEENDPLWDGRGCGAVSSCCEFNNPPYFCKHLNYTTNDDIELRLFTSYNGYYIPTLSLIELYIK